MAGDQLHLPIGFCHCAPFRELAPLRSVVERAVVDRLMAVPLPLKRYIF